MIVKVCGINTHENLEELVSLNIHWLGFIFYEPSKRFAGHNQTLIESLNQLAIQQRKVGVFVDADISYVLETAHQFKLDVLQFHGNESPAYVEQFANDFTTVKVFSIDNDFNFNTCQAYNTDYFLFDTATKMKGGSGIKFDWNALYHYKGNTPFFLSGGIAPGDYEKIQAIDHPLMAGIDLNSRFEVQPGRKDLSKIQSFLNHKTCLTK